MRKNEKREQIHSGTSKKEPKRGFWPDAAERDEGSAHKSPAQKQAKRALFSVGAAKHPELGQAETPSRIVAPLSAPAGRGGQAMLPGLTFSGRGGLTAIKAPTAPPRTRVSALVMSGYDACFGLDMLSSALLHAQARGLNLMVKLTQDDPERETRVLEQLVADGVDGVIIQAAPRTLSGHALRNVLDHGIPLVMLGRSLRDVDAPSVGMDQRPYACLATEQLLDAGHRNLAFIALQDGTVQTVRERMAGFQQAIKGRNLLVDKALSLTGLEDCPALPEPPDQALARHERCVERIARHLTEHPEITAIFAAEFAAAQAVWDAVCRMGKTVPTDLSIVCFDKGSGLAWPNGIGHIRQPQEAMGRAAVDALLRMLEGETIRHEEILLEGQWVPGASIAAPSH